MIRYVEHLEEVVLHPLAAMSHALEFQWTIICPTCLNHYGFCDWYRPLSSWCFPIATDLQSIQSLNASHIYKQIPSDHRSLKWTALLLAFYNNKPLCKRTSESHVLPWNIFVCVSWSLWNSRLSEQSPLKSSQLYKHISKLTFELVQRMMIQMSNDTHYMYLEGVCVCVWPQIKVAKMIVT